jgi:GntR family transcriptional regulator
VASLDHDHRPPYLQVAAELRAQIAAGALDVGERIPSGREIAERYGVASMTAQKATNLLKDEGLIASQPGRGLYVVRKPDRSTVEQETALDEVVGQVTELRQSLEHLAETVESAAVSELRKEIADLRHQVGTLQANLVDLYEKVGQSYPKDHPEVTPGGQIQ